MFVEEEQLNSGKTLGTLHNQMAGLLLHPIASSPLVGAGKLGALASRVHFQESTNSPSA